MRATGAEFPEGSHSNIPWRARPLVTINVASQVSGISSSSIYRLASQGRLSLKRLAGRVLVETAGLIKLIETAEPWTASERGKAARQRRSDLARAARRNGPANL
jgi:hypothetical protein